MLRANQSKMYHLFKDYIRNDRRKKYRPICYLNGLPNYKMGRK